jgi:3-aminobutyryl-CoA ammonia-lyase
MTTQSLLSVKLHLRISEHDVHYAGGLVDGARIMGLFGDAATELCIRHDGDEGLFRAYQEVEFLAPVHAGDYLEVTAELTGVGRTSRHMRFSAHRIIQLSGTVGDPSAAIVLETPVLVARAVGTCVVPLDKQRRENG